MDIFKSASIEANINEKNADIGLIGAKFYTEDENTASIGFKITKDLDPYDLSKTTKQPVLYLYAADGSAFKETDLTIEDSTRGHVRFYLGSDIIKHAGRMKGILLLEEPVADASGNTPSVHIATFNFDIVDSGTESFIAKEIDIELVGDKIQAIIDANPDRFRGEEGPQGIQGEQGIQGPQGLPGKDGINGKDAVITNGSVEYQHTNFVTTGKNIFDVSKATTGKALSYTTGTVADNASYSTSGYIPVTANTQYTQSKMGSLAFYDINKVYISGVAMDGTNYNNSRTFTTPSNAAFMRTGYLSTSANIYQVELGAASTTYEPFNLTISNFKYAIPDKSITGVKLADETITFDKLAFTTKSANLFDKSKATDGKYVNPNTGALDTNASYFASDFINITGATELSKTNTLTYYAFYDSAQVKMANTNTATNTIAVPSGAVYVRFSGLMSNKATAMLVKGNTLPSAYVEYKVYIPQSLIEQTTTGTTTTTTSEIVSIYGKDNLKTYYADIAKQFDTAPTARTEIAILGDSWVQGGVKVMGERLPIPLRNRMKAIHGDGGMGFVGLANSHYSTGPVTITKTGTWTDKDIVPGQSTADLSGLDLAETETVTAGDAIKIDFLEDIDFYEIHTQVNTGTWRYNVDGGTWTTVDSSTTEVTAITMTLGKHTINIEHVSGTTTIIGTYAYKGNKGIVINKIGNGGLAVRDIVGTDRANYIKQVQRCRANTFMILVGTNDHAQNIPVADYKSGLKEVISRIREAKPLVSIILIAPSGNNMTGKLHTIDEYSNAQLEVAKEVNVAHISLYRRLGDFATTNANGLMYTDGVHPSPLGGLAIGNVVYDTLMRI